MKISVGAFKGEVPITAPRLLPPGMASSAVNANLVSGDLGSFKEAGNPFQLSKDAPINTGWLMQGPAPTYWLQWTQGEVSYGVNIDASLGTIPGDSTYRTFITGLAGGPKQTNLFYATDPSQQGGNVAGAYPYQFFPLGLASPGTAPTAVGPTVPSGPTTVYEYAQEASVNNAKVHDAGTGYKVGDVLDILGGTTVEGLSGATITVGAVDPVTQGITGVTAIKTAGFYTSGNGPTSPAATSGGTGTGATFDLTLAANTFDGFGQYDVSNGAGYEIKWTLNADRWRVSMSQGSLSVSYSQTIFNVGTAASFTFQSDQMTTDNGSSTIPDLVTYLCGVYSGSRYIDGPAVVLSQLDGKFYLYSSIKDTEPYTGVLVAQADASISIDTFYRVKVEATQSSGGTTPGFSVTATVLNLTGDPISAVSGFIPYTGESFGIGGNHRGPGDDGNAAFFENILMSVTAQADQATSESTAYVYTFVSTYGSGANAITQESGPSDPSETVTFFLDGTTTPPTMTPVSVTIPPAPADKDITNYNLYRLVQLSDGSEVFEFVKQLPADTVNPTVFSDNVLDSALGDPLQSADWVPPPDNLQGILALPNGIMAGFFANTLCLSAQNFPFAWPVGNQLPSDTAIVAIAAIDTTVLVLTTAHPYTAWGSDPSSYTMSKETANQGCVSKRSAATHKRLGVVYASGNGLCYYRGQGELDLIRTPSGDPYFSIEQWQALKPSSIIAVVHDDRYWFWYDTGTTKGGYVLDLSSAGFGLVELDFHVTAAYVDPATDTLYFTPDFSLYPINGEVVSAALNVLTQWEGGTGVRPRTWERQDMLMPRPAAFMMARVRAEDYTDVRLTVSCEGGTAFDGAVTGPGPFVMAPKLGVRWRMKLTGASQINTAELVEVVTEFAQ